MFPVLVCMLCGLCGSTAPLILILILTLTPYHHPHPHPHLDPHPHPNPNPKARAAEEKLGAAMRGSASPILLIKVFFSGLQVNGYCDPYNLGLHCCLPSVVFVPLRNNRGHIYIHAQVMSLASGFELEWPGVLADLFVVQNSITGCASLSPTLSLPPPIFPFLSLARCLSMYVCMRVASSQAFCANILFIDTYIELGCRWCGDILPGVHGLPRNLHSLQLGARPIAVHPADHAGRDLALPLTLTLTLTVSLSLSLILRS